MRKLVRRISNNISTVDGIKQNLTVKWGDGNLKRLLAKLSVAALATTSMIVQLGNLPETQAGPLTVLHAFKGYPGGPDGATPVSGLNIQGNKIYGITNTGGTFGGSSLGTIYQYTIAPPSYSMADTFGSGADGQNPDGGVVWVPKKGLFYGVTKNGGINGKGTIYSWAGPPAAHIPIYSFSGADGANPNGSLRLDPSGSVLYGATTNGGNGLGTIFKVDVSKVAPVITPNIYKFGDCLTGGADGGNPIGINFGGPLNTMLYGFTSSGGGAFANGTLFAYDTTKPLDSCASAGGAYKTLYGLNGAGDGAHPKGSPLISGKLLYGVAHDGGKGFGTVFSYDTLAGIYNPFYAFNGGIADGAGPHSGVMMATYGKPLKTYLYGTTDSAGANGNGTIYWIDLSALAVDHVYPLNDAGNKEGSYPQGSLHQAGTTLYGTASAGGQYTYGTLFSYALPVIRQYGPFGGLYNTIVLKPDGTLWGSGNNNYGQLGTGDTVNRLTPTQIGSDNSWVAVAVGNYHTVALKSNGTLWAWGYNTYGQLGTGDTANRSTPTQIGTDTNWASVATGINYTVAMKSDGSLWAWGYNTYGQLGTGDTSFKLVPTQIGADYDWILISTTGSHTVALKSGGSLWAWGYNYYGELGMGDTANRLVPTQVGADSDWTWVVAGGYHTLALKTNGTLWAWGDNSNGALGIGSSFLNELVPTQISTDQDWTAISAGPDHSMALKSNGTLWGWGFNGYGQLGTGDTVNKFTPIQIGSDSNWALISSTGNNTVAEKTDGSVYTWGYNATGELGTGDTTQRNSPVQIAGFGQSSSPVPALGTYGLLVVVVCLGALSRVTMSKRKSS